MPRKPSKSEKIGDEYLDSFRGCIAPAIYVGIWLCVMIGAFTYATMLVISLR